MTENDNATPDAPNRFERERRAVAREARIVFVIVLALAMLIYLFSGLTAIGQDEVGLQFRLGELIDQQGPGLHLNWPWPIDQVERLPSKNAAQKFSVNSFNLRATGELNEIANKLSKKYKNLPRTFWSAVFDPYLITGEPENQGLRREIRNTRDATRPSSGVDRPDITTRNVLHMGVDLNFRIEDPEAWFMQTAGQPQQILHDRVTSELIHYAAKEDIDALLRSDVERARYELRNLFQGALSSVNTTVVDLAADVLPADATDAEVRRVFFPMSSPRGERIRQQVSQRLQPMLDIINASRPLQVEYAELRSEATRLRLAGTSQTAWWRRLRDDRSGCFRQVRGMGVRLESSGGVNILDSRVPEYVAPSFERVTNARVRQGTTFNEASREAQQIVSAANIAATHIRTAAGSTADNAVEMATVHAETFHRLAVEYKKDPVEFRRRRSREALRELAPLLRAPIINMIRDPDSKRMILDLRQTGSGFDLPPTP